MSLESVAGSQVRIKPATLVPYLCVGLAWFAFLMLAFRVRMIEPVFLWVWAHGTILEQTGHASGYWTPRAILLAAYLASGILAWFLVELGGRDIRHVWRRAVLAWIGIQIAFCLIATFLTHMGVLYE